MGAVLKPAGSQLDISFAWDRYVPYPYNRKMIEALGSAAVGCGVVAGH